MKISHWNRISRPVEAVRVTRENMLEVSNWCNGIIYSKPDNRYFIHVPVLRPNSPRHTQAFVGDWVMRTPDAKTFRVYTDAAWQRDYNPTVLEEQTRITPDMWSTAILEATFGDTNVITDDQLSVLLDQ